MLKRIIVADDESLQGNGSIEVVQKFYPQAEIYGSKWNLLMAASTIVVMPCILVYLIGQKYLIEGISMTGLKA